MRVEFEMNQEQLDRLLEACRPQMYLLAGGTAPRSPQENANAAWAALGDEMLFDWKSVRPTSRGDRFFTAKPKAGYEVVKDGYTADGAWNRVWFASGPDFINLQDSPAGFGATQQAALADLRHAMAAEVVVDRQ